MGGNSRALVHQVFTPLSLHSHLQGGTSQCTAPGAEQQTWIGRLDPHPLPAGSAAPQVLSAAPPPHLTRPPTGICGLGQRLPAQGCPLLALVCWCTFVSVPDFLFLKAQIIRTWKDLTKSLPRETGRGGGGLNRPRCQLTASPLSSLQRSRCLSPGGGHLPCTPWFSVSPGILPWTETRIGRFRRGWQEPVGTQGDCGDGQGTRVQ